MTTQQILQGVHDWTNGKIVYDISVAHPDGQGKPTPYADLTAALGTGGANIPEGLRKGGMSVKFIKGSAQGSDNNYAQFRFTLSTFTSAQFTNPYYWQEISDKYNKYAVTEHASANAIITRLFIDTSQYTGSLSLSGLRLRIIARNVSNKWGFGLENESRQVVASFWINSELQRAQVTDNSIYMYAEFCWEKMEVSQLILHTILTPYAFTFDPRQSIETYNIKDGAITSDKIADENVTTAKLANGAINTEKIGEYAVTREKLEKFAYKPVFPLLFTEKYFSVIYNEGYNEFPTIFPNSEGDGTSPIVQVLKRTDNVLGVKYARKVTIKDEKYNNKYYSAPYCLSKINDLLNKDCVSFGFWFEKLADSTCPIRIGYRYTGTGGAQLYVNIPGEKGINNGSVTSGELTITCSVERFNDYVYNDKTYVFVKSQIIITGTIPNKAPEVFINFQGGSDYVGTYCYLYGVYIIPDILPSIISPFTIFPYGKSFYTQFLNGVNGVAPELRLIYGSCGDSITEGAGISNTLSENDEFRPITGLAKATYGYWIAKKNNGVWYNYGISGSCLGDVNVGGLDKNGFSKNNGRYTQLADELTHISIFFGWNDDFYGERMKKQEYATAQWGNGNTLLYPANQAQMSKIGTPGWVTQEQYDTLNSMTGEVGGIHYDNSNDYWKAVYIGVETDNTNKTFWGAWNIVLPYLINKYPLSKILLIVPYGTSALMRQTVRDAAYKYGLKYYDFGKYQNQMMADYEDESPLPSGTINGTSIATFRRQHLFPDSAHPNEDGYKYIYPSINKVLVSL